MLSLSSQFTIFVSLLATKSFAGAVPLPKATEPFSSEHLQPVCDRYCSSKEASVLDVTYLLFFLCSRSVLL